MNNTDIDAQAEWLCSRLNKKDKASIDKALNLPEPSRDIVLKVYLSNIAKNKLQALIRAIDRGDCQSYKYPDFRTENKRDVIADKMASIIKNKQEEFRIN